MDNVPQPVKSSLPWAGILNLLAAIVYGASPIDLIPDVLILLGWVDDAIAIPLFLVFAVLGFVRHKKQMQKKAQAPVSSGGPIATSAREPQIPQNYQ
jgi:uncharacterized membrane protein YkvA (DUF1232 family)